LTTISTIDIKVNYIDSYKKHTETVKHTRRLAKAKNSMASIKK